PLEVLKLIQEQSEDSFILESKENNSRGRYTFLGYQPIRKITSKNGVLKVDEKILKDISPKKYIKDLLQTYHSPKMKELPTFTGGLVGYFAYDYAMYQEETLSASNLEEVDINDIQLLLYDQIICFDHYKQKIFLIVNVDIEDLEKQYITGIGKLEEMYQLLQEVSTKSIEKVQLKTDFTPLYTIDKYSEMIQKAKHYIQEGDIFQVVSSNRFEARMTGSMFDVYRVLRTTNPSPYMFYIKDKKMEIVGASPETLVKMIDNKMYTFPLAGTRARGKTEMEDKQLREELLQDEKELAEHNMLVDLGRNDIGKISQLGSVKVESYQDIELYSHVMHISSTVSGILQKDKDSLDVVDAILPAGTLSGAPKIRAMQIIEELEEHRRGLYGGGIGYLDFTGNLDLCIAIRMAYKVDDRVFVHAGGGIVYDSEEESEYQETINKSKAVIEAIRLADGGIENDINNR
ncbi:MAG: anthranilate synthase component I family protein, partial [Coprobacillaceae bacterium]